MIDIYNNKTTFLNLKPKRLFIVVIILIIILVIILYLCSKMKIYHHYFTKGYVVCDKTCYVEALIPTDIPIEKIKLNQKEISFTMLEKTIQIDENNMVSYYKVKFVCDQNVLDKEIVNLDFYYNKQRFKY